jgi:protocatechuate 3,4-dioxygenase beta subunit
MVRPLIAMALTAATAAAGAALPQQAASISGRVLDADSGRPIAGASVGVPRGAEPVVTDAQGRYTLRPADPGRVTLHVWGSGQYQAMSLTGPRTVTVQPGAVVTGIDMRVRLEAQVSGRVLDERGQPLAGIRVVAVSRQFSRTFPYTPDGEFSGGLWHHRQATDEADDRGMYALSRLYAGRSYHLLAFRPRTYDRAISTAPAEPATRAPILAATYYPSADTLDTATPVTFTSLERREHVDIHMRTAPSLCVEATITADGAPASLPFALEDEDVARLVTGAQTSRPDWRVSGRTGPDGRLRACDLHPGRFRLTAGDPLGPRSEGRRGTSEIVVGDRDVPDVEVVTGEPIPVTGLVTLDGDAPPSGRDAVPLGVSLWPTTGGLARAETSAPGSFSLLMSHGVPYSLRTSGLESPMYVRGVEVDERALAHAPIAAPPGSAGIVLRLTVADDGGTLAVTVRDRDGRTGDGVIVLALPASASTDAELAAGLRTGATDELGAVAFDALGPGAYYVLATDSPPPVIYLHPGRRVRVDPTPEAMALLLDARVRGERVEVPPRGEARVTVSVTSLR